MTIPRGFTRCDECEGSGGQIVLRNIGSLAEYMERVPCPTCSGSGLVPTEKLRQEAVTVGRSKIWDIRTAEVVDAVLRKVAEHIGEER